MLTQTNVNRLIDQAEDLLEHYAQRCRLAVLRGEENRAFVYALVTVGIARDIEGLKTIRL